MVQVTLTDSYSIEAQGFLKVQLSAKLSSTRELQPGREDLLGTHVLLTRSHTLVDDRLLNMAPQLKVVGTATSGLNHIDLSLCKERGIQVFNAAEANTQSVAEHTLLLILSLLRNFKEADASLRSGQWRRSLLSRGGELQGQLVGIVGLGRIGTRVAQLVQAFGARSMAYDPYVDHGHFAKHGVVPVGFSELLKQCEILTLHVPLTDETRNMLNHQSMSLLSESCILVNTSRGEVINENDLVDFLSSQRLAGAGLDVYRKEPLAQNSPLLQQPRLLLSPHMGAFTEEAFQKASMDVARQVVQYHCDSSR